MLERDKVEVYRLRGVVHLDRGETQDPSGKGDVLEAAALALAEPDPVLVELGG